MELKNDASKKNLEYVTFATAPVELDYLYTTKDNIVGTASDNSNGSLTSRLEPGESGEIRITTTVTANEEAINSMNYDNLVEIVTFSGILSSLTLILVYSISTGSAVIKSFDDTYKLFLVTFPVVSFVTYALFLDCNV